MNTHIFNWDIAFAFYILFPFYPLTKYFFSVYIAYICNIKTGWFDLCIPSRIEIWSKLDSDIRPHHVSLAFCWWLYWGQASEHGPTSRDVQYKIWWIYKYISSCSAKWRENILRIIIKIVHCWSSVPGRGPGLDTERAWRVWAMATERVLGRNLGLQRQIAIIGKCIKRGGSTTIKALFIVSVPRQQDILMGAMGVVMNCQRLFQMYGQTQGPTPSNLEECE